MATLQYVGARYVLKFFDDGKGGMEWESGRSYEPLTAVTYRDSTYISRVPVPPSVGSPPENGQYWILMGSFNGWIKQLQEDVVKIQADLSSVQADLSSVQADLSSVQADLSSVQADLSSVQADLSSVPRFINVKFFGAKGDGVTDDTNSFKSAMTSPLSGAVYVPAGTYVVSDIEIIRSMYGDEDASIIDSRGALNVVGSNCTISCLKFTGGTSTGTIPIMRLTGDGNTVHNCTFENTQNIAIAITGANNSVRDCTLSSIGMGAKQAGIWMECAGAVIDHNHLSDIYLDGIAFYDSTGCKIINNYVTDCGNHPPYTNAFGACGIFCGNEGRSNFIAGNTVNNCSEGGIVLGTQYYCTISGNSVSGCGLFGIVGLYSTATLCNNVVFNNGGKKSESAISYAGYGIVQRGGNNLCIIGNVCPTGTVQKAISIGTDSSASDGVISGNRFADTITFPNSPHNILYTNLNN